jgi:hypothetical protein
VRRLYPPYVAWLGRSADAVVDLLVHHAQRRLNVVGGFDVGYVQACVWLLFCFVFRLDDDKIEISVVGGWGEGCYVADDCCT